MAEIKGIKVRIWMMKNGLRSRVVAKQYGCSFPVISKFLSGVMTSNGLVDHFVRQGCPEEYFDNGRVAA